MHFVVKYRDIVMALLKIL